MFRTVRLPSSGVYSLYTQQWYMSYWFVDSIRAGPGWKKNKFVKLVLLVDSITKKFVKMHSHMNVKKETFALLGYYTA